MNKSLYISLAALMLFFAAGTVSAVYWSYPCATLACGGYDSPYYNQPLQGWGYGYGGYGGYGGGYGDYYGGYGYPSYGSYYPQQWGGYGGGGASSYASSGIGSYHYAAPQIMTGGYGNNYASPYMAAYGMRGW